MFNDDGTGLYKEKALKGRSAANKGAEAARESPSNRLKGLSTENTCEQIFIRAARAEAFLSPAPEPGMRNRVPSDHFFLLVRE